MRFEELREHRPAAYGRTILGALNIRAGFGRGHIYAGTVPAAEVARRRARDKAAKAARKTARGNR